MPRVGSVLRAPKVLRLLCLLLPLAACTGDDEGGVPVVGNDAATIDAGTVDVGITPDGGQFDDPGDLPRVGCLPGTVPEPATGLAALWSLDTYTAGGGATERFGDILTLSADGDMLFNASALGPALAPVVANADDVFWRDEFTGESGLHVIYAANVCGVDPDGKIIGSLVQCYDFMEFHDCRITTFTGTRLARREGEGQSDGLSLVSEWNGPAGDEWANPLAVNVRVQDGVAYLVGLNDGLHVVDVSDPAKPSDLGEYLNHGGYNDVKLVTREADGHVFALCSYDNYGIDVLDVTDPAAITSVARIGENSHTVFVETKDGRTRAYYPREYEGVAVADVTDPEHPMQLGVYELPEGGFLHDLYVEDDIIYGNFWDRGLVIIDATDPANMVQLGQFLGYERRTSHSNWVTTIDGCKVAVHGDEDFSAHLRTVGVDPRPECEAQWLEVLGEVSLRPEVSIHNIMAIGTTAYVAYYQDGVRLFDVSDPTAPTQIAYYNTWEGGPGRSFFEGAIGLDVDLAKGLIYVADFPRGLIVLSIDPP